MNEGNRLFWVLCFAISSCSINPHKGISGEHRAGTRILVIYQNPEQILKSQGAFSNDSTENKSRISVLPSGGRLLFEFKQDWVLTQNSGRGVAFGDANPEMIPANEKTNIQFSSILHENKPYCECENVEMVRRPFYKWSIFGFSEKPFQSCDINKPIRGDFEILLMNFEKTPIGKYAIKGIATP